MKINSINSTISQNSYNILNKKNNNHQNINNQINNNARLMPDSNILRAYNKINFGNNLHYIAIPRHDINNEIAGVNISIPFSDDKNIMLGFEADDDIAILFKDDHSIDSKAMDLFVSFYKKIYSEKVEFCKKEIELLEGIIEKNKENNKISLYPDEDINDAMKACSGSDSLEWAENFLNGIKDKNQRDEMAYMYLDMAYENYSKSAVNSAQIALGVLKLSKTPNGFDDSQIDIKSKIIQSVYALDGTGKVLDEFIRAFKDENGNINLEAMLKTSKTLLEVMTKAVESSIDWLE